ncbi:MAG TPA: ZIP family metal transporter, partial [Polyangiales bacterium]|nr:ZIP family metal transporter [Polyangiales bacterium]
MGAGFLIALGLFSALPDACARSASVPLAIGLAVLTFAAVLLAHRAGHGRGHKTHEHTHEHEHEHQHGSPASAGLSLYDARLAIAGLALHSLLDGVAVSAALTNGAELGIFVAVFVVLHKVPEGAAAAAITYASGGTPRAARLGVLCVALAAALGALTIFAVGPLLAFALSIAAGVTSGVGVGIASHLVKHRLPRGTLGLGFGVSLFLLSEWLLHA